MPFLRRKKGRFVGYELLNEIIHSHFFFSFCVTMIDMYQKRNTVQFVLRQFILGQFILKKFILRQFILKDSLSLDSLS